MSQPDHINIAKALQLNVPDTGAYEKWRAWKLSHWPRDIDALKIGIESLTEIPEQKIQALLDLCEKTNIALYKCENDSPERDEILAFSRQLGLGKRDMHLLADENGITALEHTDKQADKVYIPYTNRPLNWHTDGYYNKPDERIRSMILHCVRPATDGGVTGVLDHEIAYIYLRDENPAYVEALMHPNAMTVPANESPEGEIRPARSGPVFEIDPISGRLHMRYTIRKRHIEWRDDPVTQDALAYLRNLLDDPNGPALHIRLGPGEGLVTNNVLHKRTGFENAVASDGSNGQSDGRKLYRGRFFDRIKSPCK